MKKVLLFALLGTALTSTSVVAMEEIHQNYVITATPAIKALYKENASQRAEFLKDWEDGLIDDSPERLAKAKEFNTKAPATVVLSSLLVTALLEREGESNSDFDAQIIKTTFFRQNGKNFKFLLHKNSFKNSDILDFDYIYCSPHQDWINTEEAICQEWTAGIMQLRIIPWLSPLELTFTISPVEPIKIPEVKYKKKKAFQRDGKDKDFK